MTIDLTGEREQTFLSLMRAGGFPSADAVIDEALRLLGQRDKAPEAAATPAPAEASSDKDDRPFWEVALELTADVPDEEWDKLPVDLAEQHDHYIYGLPKRPKG